MGDENHERGSPLDAADRSWFEPLARTFERPAYHFAVMLTRDRANASGAPFRFHDCPGYTEDASSSLGKNLANYQLNCASVGWLAPDESVTFAMVLGIPANTQPGPVSLRWTMHSAYEAPATGRPARRSPNNVTDVPPKVDPTRLRTVPFPRLSPLSELRGGFTVPASLRNLQC